MVEGNGKVAVDLNRILKERTATNVNDGKPRPKSVDELRAISQEDQILESIGQRGKMSMVEYLMWQDRQDRKAQQQPIDIEGIIEKATAPLKAQIEEMKRKEERDAQEKRFTALENKIEKLMDAISNGKTKQDDPVLEELKELKNQLAKEKEEAAKKEMDEFRRSIRDSFDRISDEIGEIQRKGTEKTKSDIERLKELADLQKSYREILGIHESKKDEEASAADLLSTGIDMFNSKVPGIVKTVGTLREGLKGGSDLPDDVPVADIPTRLPARNIPRQNRSTIPQDIKEFLDAGREENGGFIDHSGVAWQNELTGNPLSRADIEATAITDPESVRALIRQANDDYEAQQKKRATAPKPAAKPKPEPAKEEPAVKQDEAPDMEDDIPAADVHPPNNKLTEAMEYIDTGTEKPDESGKMAWVGAKNEIYDGGNGAMTKAEMIEAAEADPEGFMQTVKEHLKTLGE
jgi:hypothetical protein